MEQINQLTGQVNVDPPESGSPTVGADTVFDLADPARAYVFGFLQADGHHRAGAGRKGSITVEIKASDIDLLRQMQVVLPWKTSIWRRTRSTNFAASYECATLTLCAMQGRARLLELGLPVGRKSTIIAPPAEPFSHRDYMRGLFDADGSVGFARNGMPFLSLVTTSRAIADFTCAEILRITGARRTAKPNARDHAMNIMVASDPAASLASWLYKDASIALSRKRHAALAVTAWQRPAGWRARSVRKPWTADEDDLVMTLSVGEAARRLGRTESSVNVRRWRLRHPTD